MLEKEEYFIHPTIGISRVGNSLNNYYLSPNEIGGIPLESNVENPDAPPKKVIDFKDSEGKIKRQAAQFSIFKSIPGKHGERRTITVNDDDIEKIEWTVHLANKKATWWNYEPLIGNLMFGKLNSYSTWENPPPEWILGGSPNLRRRNSSINESEQRKNLIIDPGPRTIDQPNQTKHFNRASAPIDYKHVSFPDPSLVGEGDIIETLGEIRTDSLGNLLVLGGHGKAGGSKIIHKYGGNDTWNDDISDGPVNAKIYFKEKLKEPVILKAWVVVCPPKFAPELVNITTWDDIATDIAIKYKGALPTIYNKLQWAENDGWNPDHLINYEKDIQSILNRIADYQWVASIPSMNSFTRPSFNPHDASEANRENREKFVSFFRKPPKIRKATEAKVAGFEDGQNCQLFNKSDLSFPAEGIPLLPVNSGSNSVENNLIDKFSVLTDTQYFLLTQWAKGKFSPNAPGLSIPGVSDLDKASIGNCVGEPMCPGIEVSWNVRNPTIYERPHVIRHRHNSDYYYINGLSPDYDECEPKDWDSPTDGLGCEPGDLTKRMAIPWHADFYKCSIQLINFDNENNVKSSEQHIPTPPTFYAYWWPPQSPWHIISGATTKEEQEESGIPAGIQVIYTRGINSFSDMISAWHYLGFILNQNKDENYGRTYPYFVEKEREFSKFKINHREVIGKSYFTTGDDVDQIPDWCLKNP